MNMVIGRKINPTADDAALKGTTLIGSAFLDQSTDAMNENTPYGDRDLWLPLAEPTYSSLSVLGGMKRWRLDKNFLVVIGIISVLIIVYSVGNYIYRYGRSQEHISTNTTHVNFSRTHSDSSTIGSSVAPQSSLSLDVVNNRPQPSIATISIIGAIANPGLYYIYDDQRINDVIMRAGPLKSGADLSGINRAEYVEDGEQIVIVRMPETSYVQLPGSHMIVVNINTASIQTLVRVPGISLGLAQRIIAYRIKHGRFSTDNDLMKISGIGPVKLEKIRHFLRF